MQSAATSLCRPIRAQGHATARARRARARRRHEAHARALRGDRGRQPLTGCLRPRRARLRRDPRAGRRRPQHLVPRRAHRSATASGTGPTIGSVPRSSSSATAATRGRRRASSRRPGHSDLYVAASRYGGISFWTNELGFSRPARRAPAPAGGARADSRAAATVAPEDRLGSGGRRLRGGAVRCRRRVVLRLARQLGAQHGVAAARSAHSARRTRSAARGVQAPASDASRPSRSSAPDAHGEGRARRPDRARRPRASRSRRTRSRGEDAAAQHAVRPGAASRRRSARAADRRRSRRPSG